MVEDGNFLIPSFTYNFCNTRVFDLKKTPSETGMFANYLIKHELISRTSHPIFSFVISGKTQKRYQAVFQMMHLAKVVYLRACIKFLGCKNCFY